MNGFVEEHKEVIAILKRWDFDFTEECSCPPFGHTRKHYMRRIFGVKVFVFFAKHYKQKFRLYIPGQHYIENNWSELETTLNGIFPKENTEASEEAA